MNFLAVLNWYLMLYIGPFIIITIIIRDKKLCVREIVYSFIAGLIVGFASTHFFTFLVTLSLYHNLHNAIVSLFPATLTSAFLFFYLTKLKSYAVKKTFILIFISLIISDAAYLLSVPLAMTLFTEVPTAFELTRGALLSQGFALLIYFSAVITLPLVISKYSNQFRKVINESGLFQTVLLCLAMLLYSSISVNTILGSGIFLSLLEGENARRLLLLNIFLLVTYSVIIIVSFTLFARSLQAKYEMQLRKEQQDQMQQYISVLEQQQTAMRKFKHDYHNILLSLEGFLSDDNLLGIKDYYYTRIKGTSKILTQEDFALASLSNIRVGEIKGILTAKLMVAQTLGIDTSFEADEGIDNIPIDSVVLVRIFGIILDNAIEAICDIGHGKLRVACFEKDSSINFIVQNPCRADMPALHTLKQSGFSTKGEGRGLGLSILSELVSENSNIMLETSVDDNFFTQRISIH